MGAGGTTTVAETFVFRGSSNLSSAAYEPDTETLSLTFQDDSTYQYMNVPGHVYRDLTLAPSAGSYFHRNIKGKYPYERV